MNKKIAFWVLFVTMLIIVMIFGIKYISLDGYISKNRKLEGVQVVQPLIKHWVYYAKWSPNMDKVALIAGIRQVQRDNINLILYDVEKDEIETVLLSASRFSNINSFNLWQLDWSPDGKMLALAGKPENNQDYEGIWIINLDSNEMTFLGTGERLSWSPEGDRLVVLDSGENGYSTIVSIFNIHDRQKKEIHRFAHVERYPNIEIDWSPNSEDIIISNRGTFEPESWKFQIIKSNGTSSKPILSNSPWKLTNPIWLPNGKWLAFIAEDTEEETTGTVFTSTAKDECMYPWLPKIQNADMIDVTNDGKKALVLSWGDLLIVDIEKAVGKEYLPENLVCPK